tara:strand:+ start:113 stop:1510 length:1398 start_codon:yes stop_codon:yes gene_type:complete
MQYQQLSFYLGEAKTLVTEITNLVRCFFKNVKTLKRKQELFVQLEKIITGTTMEDYGVVKNEEILKQIDEEAKRQEEKLNQFETEYKKLNHLIDEEIKKCNRIKLINPSEQINELKTEKYDLENEISLLKIKKYLSFANQNIEVDILKTKIRDIMAVEGIDISNMKIDDEDFLNVLKEYLRMNKSGLYEIPDEFTLDSIFEKYSNKINLRDDQLQDLLCTAYELQSKLKYYQSHDESIDKIMKVNKKAAQALLDLFVDNRHNFDEIYIDYAEKLHEICDVEAIKVTSGRALEECKDGEYVHKELAHIEFKIKQIFEKTLSIKNMVIYHNLGTLKSKLIDLCYNNPTFQLNFLKINGDPGAKANYINFLLLNNSFYKYLSRQNKKTYNKRELEDALNSFKQTDKMPIESSLIDIYEMHKENSTDNFVMKDINLDALNTINFEGRNCVALFPSVLPLNPNYIKSKCF